MASSSSPLGVEKPSVGFGYKSLGRSVRERKKMVFIIVLRILTIVATLTATLVMALNKETKTFVVATIGTTTIKASLSAKFQHTPANVFFVFANGLATLHNILMLAMEICGKKLVSKGARLTLISALDIMNLAILSGGASSAAFMGQLAKKGNSHAQWNKVCDKFETFCNHGSIAILVSFIGLVFLLVLTLMSTVRLRNTNPNGTNASV